MHQGHIAIVDYKSGTFDEKVWNDQNGLKQAIDHGKFEAAAQVALDNKMEEIKAEEAKLPPFKYGLNEKKFHK